MKKRMFRICKWLLVLLLFISNDICGQESDSLKRNIVITERYLNLPVCNEADEQHVIVSIGDNSIREFDIKLANKKIDFWVFIDMAEYINNEVTIKLQKSAYYGLKSIFVSKNFVREDSIYREKLRPMFHFSSKRGWLNDPNGLVYYEGEYHLFFQHNPYGTKWGNMHWGHAVSNDLIHWKELPIAIYPHEYKDMAFSGSAVIDRQSTTIFSKQHKHPMIAIYTSTGRGECLAYSFDKGRTFADYKGNPILKHEGRDPKVFWYEPGKYWVMVVYDETAKDGVKKRTLKIFTSNNLTDWEYQSTIPEFYECPELFELCVDGNENNKKWVVYSANGQYKIGNFDGKAFYPETPKLVFRHGNAYASQTYNDMPDNRRVQIAWGNGIASPGMPFNQVMLFPTELSLKTTEDGFRLLPRPIKEIDLLHGKKYQWNDVVITKDKALSTNVKKDNLHLIAEFELLDDYNFGLNINGFELKYSANSYHLNNIFVRPKKNKIKLEVIVDKTSIEVFVNDGERYIVKPHISENYEKNIEVFSSSPEWSGSNSSKLSSLVIYEMKSIWNH